MECHVEAEDPQKPPTELPAGGSSALSPQEFPADTTLFMFILKYATCVLGEERAATAVIAGKRVPSEIMVGRVGFQFKGQYRRNDFKESELSSARLITGTTPEAKM